VQTNTADSLLSTVIADRSPHFRETLRRVIAESARAKVVGEAGTLRDALRLARSTNATLVLLDIQLAMGQPAARLRRIAESLPGLNVIVLLDEDLPGYRLAIAERWGYACIAKESAASQLPLVLGMRQDGIFLRRTAGGPAGSVAPFRATHEK
jgi:DNA-binding NarL/FixJ family response regulator